MPATSPVSRVLIVDDSPLFAAALREVIAQHPRLRLVGVASDGAEAVRLTARLRPDVISMDIMMPVLDGLGAIEQIMAATPTPILVMSADPRGRSGELSMEALRRGALDVVEKPADWLRSGAASARALCDRLHLLASVKVVRHVARRPALPVDARARPRRAAPGAPGAPPALIALVASTGGPAVLGQILGGLPAALAAPLVIVQHLTPGFCETLTAHLDRLTALRVEVASDGQRLRPGRVLVAPDERHLLIDGPDRVRLEAAPPVDGHRPSGSRLLASAARVLGPRAVGVLLTGMGADGARGLRALRDAGGLTIAQSRASCRVPAMPEAAAALDAAQRRLDPEAIAAALRELCAPACPR